MSTVGAAAALGSLVDLDVFDNQVASVETLAISVGLGVLQEVDEELGGLDGPASLADTKLLACSEKTISQSIPQPNPTLNFQQQRCHSYRPKSPQYPA